MVYGGRRPLDGSECSVVCDGMPLPDADWQLATDANGCPVWVEPTQTTGCCGCPEEDSGTGP